MAEPSWRLPELQCLTLIRRSERHRIRAENFVVCRDLDQAEQGVEGFFPDKLSIQTDPVRFSDRSVELIVDTQVDELKIGHIVALPVRQT